MRKTLWINGGLAASALLVSLAVWSRVPNPMPIHWDAAGHADGYGPRALGLLLAPAIIATLAVFIPWVARKQIQEGKGKTGLGIITLAVSGFMLGMHVLMVQAALSNDAALAIGWVMSLLGVMFAVLGGAMPLLSQNRVAGIRTPWTLASEVNWKLTHQFSAWSMGIGGAICVLSGLLLTGQAVFWAGFAAIMIGSLLPVVYSYMLHSAHKERR